jgi:hypothetical protein
MQPDVTAPGVSVIAAWSGAAGPTGLPYDQRRVAFNAQSGTSMSCPQVSGVAGLIKTLHPDWSPAAIKSAIMTTGEKFSPHDAASPETTNASLFIRDLLQSNKKYLKVPVPHDIKSFPTIRSNNVHPAYLDSTIEKDLVSLCTDMTGLNLYSLSPKISATIVFRA